MMIVHCTLVHCNSTVPKFNHLCDTLSLSHTHTFTCTHLLILTHAHNSHSDPHSVASLLVQQLLSQFSTAFLANNGSTTATAAASEASLNDGGGGMERGDPQHSLKEFLCQDHPLLLMLAIQLVGQKVSLRLFFRI